jgi:hypothetical protein
LSDHADGAPTEREEATAAQTRIRRGGDDATLDQVLPVLLELADVGDDAATHPDLLHPGRGHRHDLVAALGRPGRAQGRWRQAGAPRAQQRQAHLEVLGHDLRPRPPSLERRHVDRAGAHHHVVHREHQPRLHHDPAAHALVTEDARRRVLARHGGVDVHHAGQQRLDELDGGVHR